MRFIFITDVHLVSVTPGSRIDNYPETVFSKLQYILDECKKQGATLLNGGDLLGTPTQPDYIKNRLKSMILKSGVRFISIVGNHDLLYYSEEYLDRTSFQSLVSPGVIEYLGRMGDTSIKVGDWNVVGHSFGEPFPTGPEVTEKTIVLSHCFYDSWKEERLYVSRQDVYNSKAKFVCFGHDHNQYPIMDNGGTYVVRPGALTRGTSHTENQVRVPSYAIIDTDKGVVNYYEIPFALKFDEVFKKKYNVERKQVPVSFDEIQRFIDDLRNTKADVNPYDILMSLGKPDNVVRRSTGFLEQVGLIKE